MFGAISSALGQGVHPRSVASEGAAPSGSGGNPFATWETAIAAGNDTLVAIHHVHSVVSGAGFAQTAYGIATPIGILPPPGYHGWTWQLEGIISQNNTNRGL
jgi:hypothetical protein